MPVLPGLADKFGRAADAAGRGGLIAGLAARAGTDCGFPGFLALPPPVTVAAIFTAFELLLFELLL
ncbi:MAG TPA: hypothetical protein VFC78_08210 [Tepidisphaeraceae bacterium]|nr:hypothetical protein [Tepidisphaeraceae bacterium]